MRQGEQGSNDLRQPAGGHAFGLGEHLIGWTAAQHLQRVREMFVCCCAARASASQIAQCEMRQREVGLKVDCPIQRTTGRLSLARFLQDHRVKVVSGRIDLVCTYPPFTPGKRVRELALVRQRARQLGNSLLSLLSL